jgi:uncharacterized RDD family membrane protein YckC/predicted RNA-binding Zn-ribbon protein involved in translation (DUF1610 family)
MAKLVINPTSAAKKEIPLLSRVISIGRDPSNDLVLSDSMVSRRHAILEQRDDQYVLKDNNSSNGTLVNGDRVDHEKPLRDGDLVAIGSSRLLFQIDDTAEAPPPPPSVLARGDGAAAAPVKAAEHVRCPACGMAAIAADRFCRSCGRSLDRDSNKLVCANCGAESLLPAEFCGQCGKPFAADKPVAGSTRANRRSDFDLDLNPPVASRIERSPAPVPPRARVAGARKPGSASAGASDENAGFGVRLVAFLVDEMILGIPLLLGGLVWMALSVGSLSSGELGASATWGAALSGVYCLLTVFYYVYFWGGRGATPGKSLLGLVVRDVDGATPIGYSRALLRLLGYVASSAVLGLGFLLILLSRDRRALHDRIARTRVTRSP